MATIDFQREVIERSFQTPVVVDFWAAWCGPCRVLGPVITELSKEANGNWELVKVDTEANQEIAREYSIMSIPNVKMFHKGEMVAEFTGALPKNQIQQWLEEYLPNPEKDAFSDLLQKVRDHFSSETLNELKDFWETHPDHTDGQLYWAWFNAIRDPEASKEIVQRLTGQSKYIESIEDVKSMIQMAECNGEASEAFLNELQSAREAFRNYNLQASLQHMVQTVMINKNFCDEMPRKAMISIFHLLGEDHPLSKKYRPHFNMALY